MMSDLIQRPSSEEHASYHEHYGDRVEGDVIDVLRRQRQRVLTFIRSLTEDEASHRYEDGKWSVKQVLIHMIDNERIYSYRALMIARGYKGELGGYDQDEFADAVDPSDRSLTSIAEEYGPVRDSTLHLFSGLSRDELAKTGVADDTSLSVRAVPFIIAGHENHHLDILQDRYGMTIPSLN